MDWEEAEPATASQFAPATLRASDSARTSSRQSDAIGGSIFELRAQRR